MLGFRRRDVSATSDVNAMTYSLADMIDPDKLHQNDWSTMLVSKTLFETTKEVFTKMDWCSSHDF
jgi:hypothetical protein